MKKQFGYWFIFLWGFTLLAACARAPQLTPGAETVKFGTQAPANHCRASGDLGETYRNQLNVDGQYTASTEQMRSYGKILMQNAAYKRKGNYVQLMQENGQISGVTATNQPAISQVYVAGKLYDCR